MPLHLILWTALIVCVFAWIASLLTRDYSWVDRLWSIVPWVYVLECAGAAHWHDARLNLMGALTTLWGIRLTFNFARKGGYSGTEDYRWEVLRSRMSKMQFQLFNLFFIVLYQNALLVLIALPALTTFDHPRGLGVGDLVLTAVFVGLLAMETVADQQQWTFHQAKKAGTAEGFCTTGLFALSRHPNYFAEISQWWVIYLFGVVAAGTLAVWTITGAVLLTVLFIGSTRFTEEISLSKYPSYADYQKRVRAIVPLPRRS